MALVKTTKLAGPAKRRNPPKEIQPIGSHAAPRGRLRKPVKAAAKDKVSERVAAATEELAGGLTEAAAAAEVAQAGATTVLAETWTSDADIEAVAAVAHVKVRTLDILTGPPAGGWPQSNYIALLESDLGVLSNALGCPNLGTGT